MERPPEPGERRSPGDRRPPGGSDPPERSPDEPARRLARAPGERFAAGSAEAEPPSAASPARGVVFGVLIGIAAAAIAAVLEAAFTISAGLLVVAAAAGRFIADGLRAGTGDTLDRRGRVVSAVLIAVAAVGLTQLALWLYARSEGGVLGPVDYLAQVFGALVPLQFAIAAVVAWWSAR